MRFGPQLDTPHTHTRVIYLFISTLKPAFQHSRLHKTRQPKHTLLTFTPRLSILAPAQDTSSRPTEQPAILNFNTRAHVEHANFTQYRTTLKDAISTLAPAWSASPLRPAEQRDIWNFNTRAHMRHVKRQLLITWLLIR